MHDLQAYANYDHFWYNLYSPTLPQIWNSLLLNMPVAEVMSSLPALGRRGFLTVGDTKAQEDLIVKEICHKVMQRLKDNEAIQKEK